MTARHRAAAPVNRETTDARRAAKRRNYADRRLVVLRRKFPELVDDVLSRATLRQVSFSVGRTGHGQRSLCSMMTSKEPLQIDRKTETAQGGAFIQVETSSPQ